MNEYMVPLLLVLLASVFQGTFGLGMKYIKPLAWNVQTCVRPAFTRG